MPHSINQKSILTTVHANIYRRGLNMRGQQCINRRIKL
jgi:hypothetical protein